MQNHETESFTDLPDHLRIGLRLRRTRGENFRAVADNLNAIGADTLGKYAVAHVFAKYDHASCPAQSPPVQFFPDAREQSWRDDRSTHCHVRIHIPDVVEIRLVLEHRGEGAKDSFERRIGHG